MTDHAVESIDDLPAGRGTPRHARSSASGSTSQNLPSVWRLTSLALMLLLAAVWFVALRPQALGGPAAYVGVDGISMTPTLRNGDIAVLSRQRRYRIGDVIAYRIPAGRPGAGMKVIHRIVAGDATNGFVTRGDHNGYADYFWHPRSQDVIGRVWLRLPRLATLLARLRNPTVMAGVVGVTVFLLIVWPRRRDPSDGDYSWSTNDVATASEEVVAR